MQIKRMPFAATLSTARLLCLALCLLAGCTTPAPQPTAQPAPNSGPLTLLSPDGKIQVSLSSPGALAFALDVDGRQVLTNSHLGLAFHDGAEIGADAELLSVLRGSGDNTWENRFGKHREVRNHYNELRLELREKAGARNFEVIFRAFDDGIGFRYVLPSQPGMDSFTVDRELTEFAFPGNYTCFAGQQTNGFKGSQEWEFEPQKLADIKPDSIIGLPLLVQTPAAWVAITESDLRDWSGMWIGGKTEASGAVTLSAKLAPRREGDGLVKVLAPHNSPWRTLIIGREPGRLIESDLVLNLAPPSELADTSWIKPGMMAWDHWWSGDVKMDTATIKQYIQLASDMGWPYQLIDWQWYGPFNKPDTDITHINPALDMDELLRFAKEKNVRLWLWLYWTDADRNDAYEKAFALYEQWGIAGIKIDFMDSDDQFMVNWYEKLTRAAAAHHLMINFHGAFKPTGLNRTFPNQITREGVLGNEYNRWSTRVTPEHKLTLPFTRFLAGPADFTLAVFSIASHPNSRPIPTPPKSRARAPPSLPCSLSMTARSVAPAIIPLIITTNPARTSLKLSPPSGTTPACRMARWRSTW